MLRQIPFSALPGIGVGHASDPEGCTGCTVLLADTDMAAGIDVRGGGPASRETPLLAPAASCTRIHAILLAGGSAFGLRAAEGVTAFLEEQGRGFDTGFAKVPLVCASCLYDLEIGSPSARPDAAMARRACLDAANRRSDSGCIGAGTGCTVGKLSGVTGMMKTGLGCTAVQSGDVMVGAVAAVNALGDVFEADSGRELAGQLAPGAKGFVSSEQMLMEHCTPADNLFTGNTTLAVVVTNAAFDKTRLTKIAAMAHNGLARTIRPLNTSADGDTVYAVSTGTVPAGEDALGTLAARVLAEAVRLAVTRAGSMAGYPAHRDLTFLH